MEGFYLTEEQLLLNKERKRFNRVGLGFFAFGAVSFLVSQVLATLYVIIMQIVTGQEVTAYPGWFTWTISIVALYVFAAPAAYLILRTTPAKAPERKRLNAKGFFFFTMLAFLLMTCGSVIGNVINMFLTLLSGEEQGGAVSDALLSSDIWLSVLYTGILAPVFEELFFRKFLIDRLHGAGDGIILLMSGLMFGLFHGNLEQFFYAALIGALLAYVYLNTGNVWYCIGIHVIINFCGGLIPMIIQLITASLTAGMAEAAQENIMLIVNLACSAPMWLFAFIGFLIFVIYFAGMWSRVRKGDLPMKKVSGAAFGNVGVILFLVLCGVEIILNILL